MWSFGGIIPDITDYRRSHYVPTHFLWVKDTEFTFFKRSLKKQCGVWGDHPPRKNTNGYLFMIITLDGPAGVGKSTLAKRLSKHFAIACLDTGAMYRILGFKLGVEVADMKDETLMQKLDEYQFSLKKINDEYVLHLNDIAIGDEIRTERVGRLAAIAGGIPLIRKALQKYQRAIGDESSLVTEGRDMGTTVFPHAFIKFFLDASPEVRAERRFQEMQNKNIPANYDDILKDITARDRSDRQRSTDPLIPAHDAIIVDTSDMDAEQVFTNLVQLIENKKRESNMTKNAQPFSHLAKDGTLAMVPVEHKASTMRKALAAGFVCMSDRTLELLRQKALPKGDVLSVAKVAGIMAAKRTADLIPLCHPLMLTYVDIRFNVVSTGVEIVSEVRTCHNTGVEMEAIIAVQIAAATIYDMVKAVQKDMVIENIHLLYKEGGKGIFKAKDFKEEI